MADGERVLLLTRPKPQSLAFLSELEEHLGRRVPAVISPVMRIEPVAPSLDPAAFRTVIVTSSNAVSSLLDGKLVVTVGEKTAARAAEVGGHAQCLGETVDQFLERIDEVEGPALYLRGVYTRGDLAARAVALGIAMEETVVYDQVAEILSDEAKKVLVDGLGVVPLFSPRSAALVAGYSVAEHTHVIAISEATADAWTAGGHVSVAPRPDAAAMLEMVARAF